MRCVVVFELVKLVYWKSYAGNNLISFLLPLSLLFRFVFFFYPIDTQKIFFVKKIQILRQFIVSFFFLSYFDITHIKTKTKFGMSRNTKCTSCVLPLFIYPYFFSLRFSLFYINFFFFFIPYHRRKSHSWIIPKTTFNFKTQVALVLVVTIYTVKERNTYRNNNHNNYNNIIIILTLRRTFNLTFLLTITLFQFFFLSF